VLPRESDNEDDDEEEDWDRTLNRCKCLGKPPSNRRAHLHESHRTLRAISQEDLAIS
jgi:hypothetical protein